METQKVNENGTLVHQVINIQITNTTWHMEIDSLWTKQFLYIKTNQLVVCKMQYHKYKRMNMADF